ncbi:MAG: DNA repair exonuclease [Polyangiales bacterium]
MPRFLHAADLHLDSPLLGLSLGDEKADESVRAATRRAFERLVEVAVAEGVRFVILAGDVFDGRDSSFESTVFLNTHAGRLFREHGIRTYMVRGNHDPENLFARKLVTPEGLHVFSADAAESIEVPGEGVVLHGRSYPTQAVREDLVPGYGAPVPGKLNVGVLHTALSAAPRDGHEPYAPTTLSELADKGYAYWALGHVHTRATYEERGTKAVFPGNLQSRHAREAERFEHPAREGSPGSITGRGVAIVDYEGTAITGVRHVPCDVVRWLHLAIDVSGAEERKQVIEAFGAALEAASRAESSKDAPREVIARVELRGRTRLADELVAHADLLRKDLVIESSILAPTLGRRVHVEELELSRLSSPVDSTAFAALVEEVRRELSSLGAPGELSKSEPLADLARIVGGTPGRDAIPGSLDESLENEILAHVRDALLGAR